ncbi:hypothetical protein ACFQS6_09155 [Xanthomonas populi]
MNAELASVYADQQPQRAPSVQDVTPPRPVVFAPAAPPAARSPGR